MYTVRDNTARNLGSLERCSSNAAAAKSRKSQFHRCSCDICVKNCSTCSWLNKNPQKRACQHTNRGAGANFKIARGTNERWLLVHVFHEPKTRHDHDLRSFQPNQNIGSFACFTKIVLSVRDMRDFM